MVTQRQVQNDSNKYQLSGEAGAARLRRFNRALLDLGLSGIVGKNWIRYVDGSFTFGDLNDRSSDALLRRLEDLTSTKGAPVGTSRAAIHGFLHTATYVAAPLVSAPSINPAHIHLPS
jgi:hypothetical protein